MTEHDQKKLGKVLWDIADDLRGAMNADDFRDYMLSFLFLRYLSDNYQNVAEHELGDEYPESNGHITPLQRWYEENATDVAAFEDMMRRQVHYVIHPDYLWGNIAEMARTQQIDLLETLKAGFKHIEEYSFGRSFKGLFSEINLTSDKLGKDHVKRNEKLCTIISKIADGLNQFSTDVDTLGDAYEYLLEQFAAGSGKKAGEFYTPQQISSVLSGLVTLDGQNPQAGKKKHLESVLDFACGSGALLLNVRNQITKSGGTVGKIYGQESNVTTYNLARMNMLLHGMKDTEFEIFHGDTLKNDWDVLSEENPAKKLEFDAIVANPPFSLKWEVSETYNDDFRFKSYGIAPKSAADFAFLLHGFHFLKQDGTMAIILPHGVLFRGGKEEQIRKKLIDDNHIDAVIGLPANLFYSTGIPVCVLVLKKCKRHEDILFINASAEGNYEKGKRQNTLRKEDISKIVETYQQRSEEERYAKRIPLDRVKDKEGYNLNISRYVSTAEAEKQINLDENMQVIQRHTQSTAEAKERVNSFMAELNLPQLP